MVSREYYPMISVVRTKFSEYRVFRNRCTGIREDGSLDQLGKITVANKSVLAHRASWRHFERQKDFLEFSPAPRLQENSAGVPK